MPAHITSNADLQAVLAARTNTLSSHYELDEDEEDAFAQGDEQAAAPPLVPRLPTSTSHLNINDSGPPTKKRAFTWGSSRTPSTNSTLNTRPRGAMGGNANTAISTAKLVKQRRSFKHKTSHSQLFNPAAGAAAGAKSPLRPSTAGSFMSFRFRRPHTSGNGSVSVDVKDNHKEKDKEKARPKTSTGAKSWGFGKRPATANVDMSRDFSVQGTVDVGRDEQEQERLAPSMPLRPPPPPPPPPAFVYAASPMVPLLGGNVEYAADTTPPVVDSDDEAGLEADVVTPVAASGAMTGIMAFPPRSSSLGSPLGSNPVTHGEKSRLSAFVEEEGQLHRAGSRENGYAAVAVDDHRETENERDSEHEREDEVGKPQVRDQASLKSISPFNLTASADPAPAQHAIEQNTRIEQDSQANNIYTHNHNRNHTHLPIPTYTSRESSGFDYHHGTQDDSANEDDNANEDILNAVITEESEDDAAPPNICRTPRRIAL